MTSESAVPKQVLAQIQTMIFFDRPLFYNQLANNSEAVQIDKHWI